MEVLVSGWLGDRPRTITFDRLDFVLGRSQFQRRIDDMVITWPRMDVLGKKQMFVVHHNNIWQRAVYKCTAPDNVICIQLIDSSTVLVYNNELNCRIILDDDIIQEPRCRSICYLFGLNIVNDITTEMVETYNQFFTKNQLTAVMYSEPQKDDVYREVFFGDFLLETPNGTVSFRDTLLERRFAYVTAFSMKNWLNIHLEEIVVDILKERNLTPVSFNDEFDDPDLPPIQVNELIELTKDDIANLPDAKDNLTLGDYINEGGVGFKKSSFIRRFLLASYQFLYYFIISVWRSFSYDLQNNWSQPCI